jgi:hypothetical protein
MMLGQSGAAPYSEPASTSGGATQTVIIPSNSSEAPPPRRGLFGAREDRPILSRIQSWFGRRNDTPTATETTIPSSSTPYITPPSAAPTPAPASEYHRRMPSPTSKATDHSDTIVAERVVSDQAGAPSSFGTPVASTSYTTSASSPLRPATALKVGRDEKFAWITGQLEIENGVYVLYYATPETVDKHNGRIVLQTNVDMKQFQRGDLVCAQGEVQDRIGLRGGNVVYRASNVGLIEKGRP